MKVLIVGATGEVGGHILDVALNHHSIKEIHVAGRKAVTTLPPHPKLRTHVIDFSRPHLPKEILKDAHVFWAVGTEVSPSYEIVDLHYPLAFAALSDGLVASFNLVSAMGATSTTA